MVSNAAFRNIGGAKFTKEPHLILEFAQLPQAHIIDEALWYAGLI